MQVNQTPNPASPTVSLNPDDSCHLITESGREPASLLEAVDAAGWLIVRDVPFTIEIDGSTPRGSVRAAIFDGTVLRSEFGDAAQADALLRLLAERAQAHANAGRAASARNAGPSGLAVSSDEDAAAFL